MAASTVKDVAKKAEVSTATVSHVLNKTRFVSDELTERVNKAIRELGYYPNLLATSMRNNQTYTIGLVMPSISNETFSALAENIQKILFDQKYHVIICNTSYDDAVEIDAFNTLLTKKIDGIIVILTSNNSERIVEIQNLGIPILLVDRLIPGLKVDSVIVDNVFGMYKAAMHLIELGHKSIGYLDRMYDQSHNIDQKKGFFAAMKDSDLTYDSNLMVRADGFDYVAGERAIKKLFSKKPFPTAVIAYYDILALGAIRGLSDLGLEIPKDVSLLGYDGMPVTISSIPRLTTIRLPLEQIAQSACKILLQRIQKPDFIKIRNLVIKPELLIRESTGPI